MEILDRSQTFTKKQLTPGILIQIQGEKSNSFNLLHSGMMEVLYTSTPVENPEELIKSSHRIGLIKGEAMVGITGLLNDDNTCAFSLRAVSECIVSTQPMEKEDLINLIHKDNSFNYKILRDLCSRIESSIYLYTNYKYLWHKYSSIADSIALALPGEKTSIYDPKNRKDSTLTEYSGYLKALVKEDDLAPLPSPWDYNLFLGKVQDTLQLYVEQDNISIEDLIDHPQYLFMKRLIHKNDKILIALFSKDEPLNHYIFNFLKKTIAQIMTAAISISTEIIQIMDIIYNDDGWASQMILKAGENKPEMVNFLHFLTKFSWRCRKDTMTLLGIDLFKEYKVFGALKKYQSFQDPETDVTPNDGLNQSESTKKRLKKYGNLMNRILEFSTLDETFKAEFKALMNQFHRSNEKLESSHIPIREKLSEMYWRLYEDCFLKVIASDLKGFIPGIMLHMGVVDERLLTENELLLIDDFYTNNLYSDDGIPVMTLPYFLEKIYTSVISPSMTEMGDLFPAVLKAQEKLTKKEKTNRYIYENTPEDRIRFEIRNISGELSKMLSENKKKALPFLCSDSFTGEIHRFFLEPERIAQKVKDYRVRDFSLFYREVLFKHKLGSEFIKKEVVPNFVLYPVFGSRSIMWQEMEGNNKNSPGRIFFPILFAGKKEESLLEQLANFRWELQKSIAGYNWTDPVEGGLVGTYYDYIHYYKKNPNITSEAKERLAQFIKKTRDDKDRFAREYALWVNFEFEGKMRLNGYARDIFYRFCPFPKELRETMAQKPAYKIMDNRYRNRQQKELLKIKSRIIKFEKKGLPLPNEIRYYMDFLDY